MEEHRVRIRDIAEELGLSTATVSNVLHGKTKKVSDETAKRVQALLEERQYIPSMAGILLAQNASKMIGVVINNHEKYEGRTLEDAFVASSLNFLSYEIEKQGCFMMVKQTKEPEEIIAFASMWNMDGLVVIGFCAQDYMYLRNHMRIPFVVYDGFCENLERIFNITIDNYDGGFQVGNFFKKSGHKRALCISDNDICMDKERYDGFCDGFGKENAEFMMIPMTKEKRWKYYLEKKDVFQNVSAVFAVSDYYAACDTGGTGEHQKNIRMKKDDFSKKKAVFVHDSQIQPFDFAVCECADNGRPDAAAWGMFEKVPEFPGNGLKI
ncbi:MAG: LacI family transcriptional regulator [Lachnospiraceae bacterium]|nr:LacI family transcriptional regulator [Lachnospiraceae bacterium]